MVLEWCIGELRKINTNRGELIRILVNDLDQNIFRAGAGESDMERSDLIKEIECCSTRFVVQLPGKLGRTEFKREDYGTAQWPSRIEQTDGWEGVINNHKFSEGLKI